MPKQKRRVVIVGFEIAEHFFFLPIRIAIGAKMEAGVIGPDVIGKKASAISFSRLHLLLDVKESQK